MSQLLDWLSSPRARTTVLGHSRSAVSIQAEEFGRYGVDWVGGGDNADLFWWGFPGGRRRDIYSSNKGYYSPAGKKRGTRANY